MKEEVPFKESFLINFMEINKNSNFLMYKGFVYNFLRNENIVDELKDEKIVMLEKERLKNLENTPFINWFRWWKHLLNDHDYSNPIDTYWIFKKIDNLNINIKNKYFNN